MKRRDPKGTVGFEGDQLTPWMSAEMIALPGRMALAEACGHAVGTGIRVMMRPTNRLVCQACYGAAVLPVDARCCRCDADLGGHAFFPYSRLAADLAVEWAICASCRRAEAAGGGAE